MRLLTETGMHIQTSGKYCGAERQEGRSIDVVFKGELREEQKTAMNEMLQFDNGILHAATAFGKTVVCSAIIAEKKVNTLIVLKVLRFITNYQKFDSFKATHICSHNWLWVGSPNTA